jgi:putative glutathione S-transferase
MDPEYTGKAILPVLWDKHTKKIINNNSNEIMRMFNSAFNKITGDIKDFYPRTLQLQIDSLNTYIEDHLRHGIYNAGLALNQKTYDQNVKMVFKCLDDLDGRLESSDVLVGDTLTEADIKLYSILIRFDSVYHGLYKCNLKMVKDYKNISRYLRDLYSLKAFRETTDFDHIKEYYYFSKTQLNPSQIVPIGPEQVLGDELASEMYLSHEKNVPVNILHGE